MKNHEAAHCRCGQPGQYQEVGNPRKTTQAVEKKQTNRIFQTGRTARKARYPILHLSQTPHILRHLGEKDAFCEAKWKPKRAQRKK